MSDHGNPFPCLAPGSTLGVMAASGAFDADVLDRGVATLEEMGFRVKLARGIHDQLRYLAGSDAQRAASVAEMFADPEVDAVIAARGGSGALRILPLLDWEALERHGKPLVGFSDVSALLAPLADRGMPVIHAPNVTTMAQPHARTREWFFDALTRGPQDLVLENGESLSPGRATGRLVGGNLATLNHLTGTRFQPDFSRGILFIEDIGEPAYKMDRMLSQMKLAGMFDDIQGVVVGEFVHCEPMDYITAVLGEIFPRVPMFSGLPAGHGELNFPLFLGRGVEMDAEAGSLRYLTDVRDNRGSQS